MRIGRRDYTIDWLHLFFLVIVASIIVWYVLDARAVSLNVDNLLMIEPVAGFALVLCLVILPQCFQQTDQEAAKKESASKDTPTADPFGGALPTEFKDIVLVVLIVAAFAGLVVLMNYWGFDVAIWLFCLVAMAICGERRPLPLLIYPLAVTVIGIYGFRALMPYPMHTIIL